jgi:hypothetical protein
MRFNRDVWRWGQWLFVLASLCLSVFYLMEPERQTFLKVLSHWRELVRSYLADAPAQGELASQSLLLKQGQPLLEYDALHFLGCDLAMESGQWQLVTYWDGELSETHYDAHFRLNSPTGATLLEEVRPVVTSALAITLPSDFYSVSQRGKVWLKLVDTNSGELVEPTFALPSASEDGWRLICS